MLPYRKRRTDRQFVTNDRVWVSQVVRSPIHHPTKYGLVVSFRLSSYWERPASAAAVHRVCPDHKFTLPESVAAPAGVPLADRVAEASYAHDQA